MEQNEQSSRRIDADEANRQAQDIDNQGTGREIPIANTETQDIDTSAADASSHAGRSSSGNEVYPPDVDGDTTVGGSPEEQAMLREEQRR
ncbi:MAG: hypothetical protein M3Z66_14045 [Chloroflexota bacterium]|nr:hypothetical protein [Chloroflexota bacterium]